MNLNCAEANVRGCVGTAVVCVSHKVAGCSYMCRNYGYRNMMWVVVILSYFVCDGVCEQVAASGTTSGIWYMYLGGYICNIRLLHM
jgi:hypothetical protein